MGPLARAVTLVLALTLSACAGMAEHPLGIPASSSGRFYPAMEAVAGVRGMMVSKHPGSLNVQTQDGDWLQYMQRQDAIVLVIIANTDGLSEAQIEERKVKLKGLSDDMVAEAGVVALGAKAFE